MTISAADVAKLRKMTGAGMMDCKQALAETDGDFDKAIDYLREKGKKVALKRADREATEGVVLSKASADGKYGALIVLNCETDFVAKNNDFIVLAQNILDAALVNKPSNLEEAHKMIIEGKSVEDLVVFMTGVIGEKISLSFFDKIDAEFVHSYIHPGNKVASLVGFNKADFNIQAAKDIAMQVAAMDPVALDKDDVPQSVIDNEIHIGKELARQEGKPEAMLEKIAIGRLTKFYEEYTLMNQSFVKDSKKIVRQYLQEVDKSLIVTAFKRFSLKS
jgi:elongation factor Ts